MTIPYLRNFVLIGLPVTEAESSFLLPLSAHEIGHSVWSHHRFADRFSGDIDTAVVE